MTPSQYRPDIEGLRAVAVSAVLFFHFGFETFSNGQVGVDVFFVISGFFITSLILKEIHNTSTFCFSNFYIRRARRLLPSLFFTLFLSFVFAYFLFYPIHFQHFGGALVHATIGTSNFFFWSEANYFDPVSIFKPLIHTWSLGVEEQFYIAFPLFMFFILRHYSMKSCFSVILICALLSFFMFEIFHESSFRFFFPVTRAWEFSLGAGIAFYPNLVKTIRHREALLLMGLLLIISATLSWDAPKYFGSAKELMATLGAALIILCGENNKFDILLTNKVCRKIGQISYSLYLIHWPIIVFYNYYFLENFSHLESVLLIAFSIVMALLMYRYIEQPLRIKSNQLQKIDKKQTTIYFLVSGLLLIILAANAWGNNGWPSRFKNLLYPNLESQFNVDVQNSHTLIANNSKEKFAKNTPIRIVALGDSHSVDLTTGILQNITSNIEVQNILFHSSCYSERDTRTLASQVLGKQSSVCANNLSNISENTLIEEATHIIIAQKWAKGGLENLRENILSVKNIFGDRLVILGQNVFFTKLYPIIFSTEVRSSLNSLAFKTINPKSILFNDQLRKIATSNGIRFLDRQKIVCDFEKKICLLMAEGGGITYIDSDHWSSEGDRLFGKIILSQILNYK